MFSMVRNILLLLFIVSLSAPFNYNASADDEVHNFINNTVNTVVSIIEDKNATDAEKQSKLVSLFENVVDAEYMGKMAIGRPFSGLNPDDRSAYLAAYRKYLIAMYVPKFKEHNSGRYKILSVLPHSSNYTVNMDIMPNVKDDKKYNIQYLLHRRNDRFVIRDIVAEQVSLIATQRADFSSILDSSGIKALTTALEQKSSKAQD